MYEHPNILNGWRVKGGWGYHSNSAEPSFERHATLKKQFLNAVQQIDGQDLRCGGMIGNVTFYAVPRQFNKGLRQRFANTADDPSYFTPNHDFFEAYICSWK